MERVGSSNKVHGVITEPTDPRDRQHPDPDPEDGLRERQPGEASERERNLPDEVIHDAPRNPDDPGDSEE